MTFLCRKKQRANFQMQWNTLPHASADPGSARTEGASPAWRTVEIAASDGVAVVGIHDIAGIDRPPFKITKSSTRFSLHSFVISQVSCSMPFTETIASPTTTFFTFIEISSTCHNPLTFGILPLFFVHNGISHSRFQASTTPPGSTFITVRTPSSGWNSRPRPPSSAFRNLQVKPGTPISGLGNGAVNGVRVPCEVSIPRASTSESCTGGTGVCGAGNGSTNANGNGGTRGNCSTMVAPTSAWTLPGMRPPGVRNCEPLRVGCGDAAVDAVELCSPTSPARLRTVVSGSLSFSTLSGMASR
mmetsp:Transcript_122537/g.261491  ORF Transcript_122537/g.261491 Transcript_122537/m.261491 type:complete len:301 (-) Transcript_122537:193-1095(-)